MSAAIDAVRRIISEKVFELPLSPDYCRGWGVVEAAREIEQNAIDSDSPFDFELTDERLVVRSRNATLDARTLLLGQTSKAERADAIGRFGEGYKIALLVLARDGYDVTVYNGDVVWRPEFRFSKTFGAEILSIVQSPAPVAREGLSFEVAGLREGDAARIREACLQMQDDVGAVVETPLGRILRDRPGKLYVGGLYVCDTKMTYGYDAKPEHLKLERDRKTVDGFDLAWYAKEVWFVSGLYDEIAAGVEAGVPDFVHAQYGTPQMVKEACYRLFVEKHPGKIAAKSQSELDQLVKDGFRDVVYVREGFHSIVSSSTEYRQRTPGIRGKSPRQRLNDWLDAHEFHIHASARKDMEKIIERAKNWTEGSTSTPVPAEDFL